MEEEEIAIKFYKRMMMMIVVLYKQESATKDWENTGIPFPLSYPNNPFFMSLCLLHYRLCFRHRGSSPELRWLEREANHSSQFVSSLTHGAISPLSCMTPWRGAILIDLPKFRQAYKCHFALCPVIFVKLPHHLLLQLQTVSERQ